MRKRNTVRFGLAVASFITLFTSLHMLNKRLNWLPNPVQPVRAAAIPLVTDQTRIKTAFGQLPLSFETNAGQATEEINFIARGPGYSLFLTPTEAILRLRQSVPGKSGSRAAAPFMQARGKLNMARQITADVRMQLAGSNAAATFKGEHPLASTSNYFIGNQPAAWHTDVPHYRQVRYSDVYPGIDLLYYGKQQQLEYDFVVAPGADLQQIKLTFEGVQQMRVDANGDLVLRTAAGELRQHAPVIFQEKHGVRQNIFGTYVIEGRTARFAVGEYDRKLPLVIDPVLVYATYLGGSDYDYPLDAVVDATGNLYVTGVTSSTDFPTMNPRQPSHKGGTCGSGDDTYPCGDIFVTKLNAAGNALLYSTYLGGARDDEGNSVAVDSDGNIYLAGTTTSNDMPTQNAFQPQFGGSRDAYLVKLNAVGNELLYATYFGGSLNDYAFWAKLDSAGQLHLVGITRSTNLPIKDALQASYGGGTCGTPPATFRCYDAMVAKFNAAGNALVYSTYLGGSGDDYGSNFALDTQGNVYVSGGTTSTDFPTRNAAQPRPGGGSGQNPLADGYVTKLSPAGTLVYSTYLGGKDDENAAAIAVDAQGQAYVSGQTNSLDFPLVNPLQARFGGPHDETRLATAGDVFFAKLSAAGDRLLYSTYFGGSGGEFAYDLELDSAGNLYAFGDTDSPDFPVVNAVQSKYGGGGEDGGGDTFVAKLNSSGSALIYATYLGGSGDDYAGGALAVDSSGNAYVAGLTSSANFPTKTPLQDANKGGYDAFMVKLGPDDRSTAAAAVSAASFSNVALAVDSIVAVFGVSLADGVQAAEAGTALPTALNGVSVKIRDTGGKESLAPLFIVTPGQINCLVPTGLAAGSATLTVTKNGATIAAGALTLATVAPGLFTANANGQGVAAALALRVKADGTQSFEPLARFDAAQNRFIAVPLDLGPASDQVFLILFGTGFRYRTGLNATLASIGGTTAEVLFAGPQGLVGLDQANVRVPRSLIGKGETDVIFNVDGKTANTVRVNIR